MNDRLVNGRLRGAMWLKVGGEVAGKFGEELIEVRLFTVYK